MWNVTNLCAFKLKIFDYICILTDFSQIKNQLSANYSRLKVIIYQLFHEKKWII